MRLTSFFFFLMLTLGSAQESNIKLNQKDIRIYTRGIDDRKEGEPLVVFESGHATPLGHWDSILDEVAEFAPLIAYDRPGIGESEWDEAAPTVKKVTDRLIRILKSLELPPPYILVGHSLGGAYIRGFATYHPEHLAGLVFIDPADFTETLENKRTYYQVLDWDNARIDQELADIDQKARELTKTLPPALQAERQVLRNLRYDNFQEILKSPLPNIPVHIITGGRFDAPPVFRSKEYDSESLFRSKMQHRVARFTEVIQSVEKGKMLYSSHAGHFVHRDDPDLVIASIAMVLKDHQRLKEAEKNK